MVKTILPHALLVSLVLALAGCGIAETPDKNSLTQDENDRLNMAAEKLNQTSPPPRLTTGELPAAPAPPPVDQQ